MTKPVKKDKRLHALLDEIYDTAYGHLGLNTATFAAKAGLCYETVRRLECYETQFPRLTTVAALARAAGYELTLRQIMKQRKAG